MLENGTSILIMLGLNAEVSIFDMTAKKENSIIKSRFIRVKCPNCKNEQIIFGKASTAVKCLICEKILAEPAGGKAKIKAKVEEVLT